MSLSWRSVISSIATASRCLLFLERVVTNCRLQPFQFSVVVTSYFYDWCLTVNDEPDTVISRIVSLYRSLCCKSRSASCQLHLEAQSGNVSLDLKFNLFRIVEIVFQL